MTLKELANIFPGYTKFLVHTKEEAWNLSAGVLAAGDDFPEALVISATAINAYALEISIKFMEVTNNGNS